MNLSRKLRHVAQPVAGQSLVFSAILFFVLIGFAALAIDTGEAFSRQRQQQAASNAASISGLEAMNGLVDGSDNGVQAAIERALAANGITDAVYIKGDWGNLDPTKNYYRAFYTQRGSRVEYPIGSGGLVSSEFTGVRVEVRSARNTIFAQVMGVDTLEVSADGRATLCQCATNIFPVAIATQVFNGAVYGRDLTATWTKTKVTSTNEVRAAVWAEWRSGSTPNGKLQESLSGTGDYILGYGETSPPPGYSNTSNNGVLNSQDWTKVSDSVLTPDNLKSGYFSKLVGKRVLVPTFDKLAYSGAAGSEKYTSFRSAGFVEIQLTSVSGNAINFKYISSNSMCPCVDVPPPVPPPSVKLGLDQKLVWYMPSTQQMNYDISLVVDISGSMKSCWDSPTGTGTCSTNANARWYKMKNFISDFGFAMITAWNKGPAGQPMTNPVTGKVAYTQAGDNRIAAIRFSGNADAASPSFGFPSRASTDTIEVRTGKQTNQLNALVSWITRENMAGSTSGGRGLREAVRYFDNDGPPRTDKNGNPVKLVVVMLTDGLTNVMYEGPQVNSQNTQTLKHTRSGGYKYCKAPNDPTAGNVLTAGGSSYPITDNPEVQATCPWDGQGNGSGYAKAPIVSLVEVANTAKNRQSPLRPINIYAILMGNQGLYDASDLRIDQVASPGGAFYASTPTSLDQALDAIVDDLGELCYQRDAIVVGSGAKVQVYDAAGNPVAGATNLTTAPNGEVTFTVPEPGNYSFSASRSLTSWSEFPMGSGESMNPNGYNNDLRPGVLPYIPQLANRLKAPEATQLQNRVSFNVPEGADNLIDLGKFTLNIAEAQQNKGICPE
ncbi:TadE/TadG family protein [Herpetosiphon geysericola]|uniref:VWFA domain-containing protein n=1 Tax=Herpetosiphon geysericola TaxID=70996 RepID=A0A0P6Y8Q0_9CHLR|nr:VWA domain-containing protein [Herpetosiphon geysericola]KPL85428.1 hypothetical protein SE18_17480 [Herpetosiphon geysericola]